MICILDIYEVENNSANPSKFAYCFCNKYNRFAHIKLNKLTGKNGPSSGKNWRTKDAEEFVNVEDYLKQFRYNLKNTGYLARQESKNRAKTKEISQHHDVWYFYNRENINKDQIIDHIDQNKTNNAIENLRIVSASLNRINTTVKNITGERYIHVMANDTYRVRVRKQVVGYTKTLSDAVELRNNWCMSCDEDAWNVILNDTGW